LKSPKLRVGEKGTHFAREIIPFTIVLICTSPMTNLSYVPNLPEIEAIGCPVILSHLRLAMSYSIFVQSFRRALCYVVTAYLHALAQSARPRVKN
jgi:hypothetical protein